MLTEVKAYSSWQSAPTLLLDSNGRAETDLIQVRDIQGLDPVPASIATVPYGSVDGSVFAGTSVPSRNIVLTLHPNPNWDTWSYEALRRLLYSYFMPKQPTRLVFYSNDMPTVEITGIVEDVSVNQFSKDPELQVSIICPDPYFTAVNPEVMTGNAVREDGTIETIDYNGSVEGGFEVRVDQISGSTPTKIGIQVGDPRISFFNVAATVDANKYFVMSSVPRNKFVQNVKYSDGSITSLLSKITIQEGSLWPVFQPGENHFHVITDVGVQEWELSYFERFGGL